ncbi:hypothetical protein Glove_166g196 [Diversispora epigaea]|uniref:Uncharacterized protein n=1 Tax=Diversispora epigaea TaxID=1348612 RepID=A0A397ITI6_9GLOM|nr:hypothetical protein Glove_166g196 [Diversispora epigaea]
MGDLKKERETMIVEELKSIFSNDKSNIKFDFEGFVKTELGLALDKTLISVALSPALSGPVGKLFATGSGDCRARVWRYFDDN